MDSSTFGLRAGWRNKACALESFCRYRVGSKFFSLATPNYHAGKKAESWFCNSTGTRQSQPYPLLVLRLAPWSMRSLHISQSPMLRVKTRLVRPCRSFNSISTLCLTQNLTASRDRSGTIMCYRQETLRKSEILMSAPSSLISILASARSP
jgi:hypothetical protein